MAETWATGYDGYASLTTAHNFKIRNWGGAFSRAESVITGFADTGVRRRLGIFDFQGSAGGTPTYDASNTGPGMNATDWSRDGYTVVLGVVGSTQCIYTLTACVTNLTFGVAKDGDSTLACDIKNSGGTMPVETWDETP